MSARLTARDTRLLNFVGSSLDDLARKGNLSAVDDLYNPGGFFERVHHVSLWPRDAGVVLGDPTIEVHVLRQLGRRWLYVGRAVDLGLALAQSVAIGRRERVGLVRGRGVYQTSWVAAMAARRLGVPLVVSLGAETNRLAFEQLGAWPVMNSRTLSCRLEEWVLRQAQFVIVPNRAVRDYVGARGVAAEKIRLVPLRVRPEFFADAAPDFGLLTRFGMNADEPVVLYVGRLARDKDVLSLIDAIPTIHRAHPRAQFVFVGDGSERAAIERRVAEAPWGARVFLLGFQPMPVVRGLLATASVTWIPKGGFAVLEAAAAGVPLVAFDVDWQGELIHDGRSGRLVPHGDATAMAEAVSGLLAHPERARALARELKRHATATFGREAATAAEIAVYEQALGRRPAAATAPA